SVERSQHVDVAQAEKDGEQLHPDDEIDDAVAGPETVVRLLEPTGQDAVLGHAVQNAVRAYDGSVLRAGQDQDAYQHHKPVKQQFQAGRPGQVHGDSANQIGEKVRPDVVG